MSVSTNDLKNGMSLNLPEGLMTVVEFQHVKPGKGGAFVRTKLKNFRTGAVIERTYRADEKLALAVIDKREMQYLYRENNSYVFMDNENYEQLQVNADDLGDAVNYIKEGDSVILPVYNDAVVGVELPASVELLIAETEPGVQGDRVSGARKPATLETGLIVHVPLFIEGGERIKVDTRTGEYLALRLTSRAMATRREARERALGLCYELETRGMDADAVLDEQPAPPDAYAIELVRGVDEHRVEIDALLTRYSEHWAVERMPAVDRALLRIGTYELAWGDERAPGVVINEAVELAQEYSTKDSGRFINGLLSRIAEHLQEA